MDVRRLSQAMDSETALLEQFAGRQEKLLGTVRARSWAELEGELASLRELEQRVEEADRERVEALGGGAQDAGSFGELVRGLAVEARVELERSYHALSLAVVRVKGAVSRLDHYVLAVTGSLNAVLGELLPYRKGRIYCSRGRERQLPDAPIVVDRTL